MENVSRSTGIAGVAKATGAKKQNRAVRTINLWRKLIISFIISTYLNFIILEIEVLIAPELFRAILPADVLHTESK